MLYRFGGAATSAAMGADAAAVRAALPAEAVTGTRSYLTVKAADTGRVAACLPVLIACGLAGLVLALLTVAGVISGAVARGSARTRILKVIGFSPAQLAAVYAALGLAPRPPDAWPASSWATCWPGRCWRAPPTLSGPGSWACPPGWTSTWR